MDGEDRSLEDGLGGHWRIFTVVANPQYRVLIFFDRHRGEKHFNPNKAKGRFVG